MDMTEKSNLEKVRTINEVPGFNAECYAIPYTDINTGETRKRLPFMPLLAWFRLKYPEGKIASSVIRENDCFIGTARIYCSYRDNPDQYISEATVSRTYCDDRPSVSPREWAQTAAISMALRNAGFGLQFDMVSDDYSETAPDETETDNQRNAGTARAGLKAAADIPEQEEPYEVSVTAEEKTAVKELSDEEKFEKACLVPCPLTKFRGNTLGDLISLDPNALKWIAEKYSGNPEVKAAALFICEYSLVKAGC